LKRCPSFGNARERFPIGIAVDEPFKIRNVNPSQAELAIVINQLPDAPRPSRPAGGDRMVSGTVTRNRVHRQRASQVDHPDQALDNIRLGKIVQGHVGEGVKKKVSGLFCEELALRVLRTKES
jgi:hypothetical protein